VDKRKITSKEFIKVRPYDMDVHTPAGHDDTYNKRLVGPEIGSKYVEVILGEMGPKGVADTHVHNDLEQVIYLLEGALKIISHGIEDVLEPGDLGFIPVGVSHQLLCESGRAKFLIIYAPPKEK
jgi:quercetin dioxygenase-like cupin family protein